MLWLIHSRLITATRTSLMCCAFHFSLCYKSTKYKLRPGSTTLTNLIRSCDTTRVGLLLLVAVVVAQSLFYCCRLVPRGLQAQNMVAPTPTIEPNQQPSILGHHFPVATMATARTLYGRITSLPRVIRRVCGHTPLRDASRPRQTPHAGTGAGPCRCPSPHAGSRFALRTDRRRPR